MGEEEVRLTLRLPVGLRDKLVAATETSHRSMNAEIVERLEASLGPANPNFEITTARARLQRAVHEMKDALAEFEIAEMMG